MSSAPISPDLSVSFHDALINYNELIKEEMNIPRKQDINNITIAVIGHIMAKVLGGSGREHFPHPNYMSLEKASVGAIFIMSCIVAATSELEKENININHKEIIHKVFISVYGLFTPNQIFSIMDDGRKLYFNMIDKAELNANLRNWIETVDPMIVTYIKSHDSSYIPLLVSKYLDLLRQGIATTENINQEPIESLNTNSGNDLIYKDLLQKRNGRSICCGVCGERYNFDKLNMCKECGSVYCYRCVWDSSGIKKRQCDCGGEID